MDNKFTNHLVNEKSPYLLQHKNNPINWFPWGEEALTKAKKENKPLFISIGYSACHWCHVMAKESFENEEVAKILNENFVSIKVDREEREDIDSVYMAACIAMNGQGGWPLTVIATPDEKPFFAGTYLPIKSAMGKIGLIDLLNNIKRLWTKDNSKLMDYGQELTEYLKKQNSTSVRPSTKGKDVFYKAFEQYDILYDKKYGGFGQAPKFPAAHNLMFLMRYYHFENNQKAMDMVEKTLESMYRGGIFDHRGGGLCRYSTDEKWLVPHFEKMLYDNCLLSVAYLEAYQITRKDIYKNIAEFTLEFIIRELLSTKGGFWTALDADAEGKEGLFYTFDKQEIENLLCGGAEKFIKRYNITEEGDYEGKNVINIIDQKCLYNDKEMQKMVQAVYHYRKNRYKLGVDDKILTSLNSLAIWAFIKAYEVTGNDGYLTIATKAVNFIEENLIDENDNIYVSFRDKRSDIMGMLDDYAYYAFALVNMYEATFELKYLKRAMTFAAKLIKNFEDSENGGYFLNDKRARNLIFSPKETFDGAKPSGNSMTGYVLNSLSRLTGQKEIVIAASRQSQYLNSVAGFNGNHYSFALIALMLEYYPAREITVVAKNNDEISSIRENKKVFQPNTNYIAKFIDGDDPSDFIEFMKDYELKNNTTTYYVCENNNCRVENKL